MVSLSPYFFGLRCWRCWLYVCALCGERLDSSDFSLADRAHARANQHYDIAASRCYKALFMPRSEWLARR